MKDSNVRLIGYTTKSEDEIKRLIEQGRIHHLVELKGEYTIVYRKGGKCVIISSYVGAMHYYYYYDGQRFSHGESIIDIVNDLRIEWNWDWESVGDLCELENLTENRTLHQHIKRVPPGTILEFDNGLRMHSKRLIDNMISYDSADAVTAVDIFNEETSLWASKKPYLSLSGGFDSRTILSAMLKQNIYPTLVTLGKEGSSDIEVAKEISQTIGLDHIIVDLEVDELLENGQHIAKLTNGSKPACHWHTHLYPKKAGVPKTESFFVGTLGEFARSYYFDKGATGILLDGFGKKAQQLFWKSKIQRHRTFKDDEIKLLNPEFGQHLSADGRQKRAERNADLSKGGLISGGCRYYLEQRVPNFYANGITLYNDTTQWRSPFHNIEWLKTIWNLSDNWKLGSNWHRLAIKRNFPRLLDFSEEKGLIPGRMLSKAPPLYWLDMMQRMKYKSYDLSRDWYQRDIIRDFIFDNKSCLSELCHPSLIERVINEHRENGSRVRGISFLLTMIYFRKALVNG